MSVRQMGLTASSLVALFNHPLHICQTVRHVSEVNKIEARAIRPLGLSIIDGKMYVRWHPFWLNWRQIYAYHFSARILVTH